MRIPRGHGLLLALALVVAVLAIPIWSRPLAAQIQAVPGNAAIWTDRSQYQFGDPIQICYRIPMAGDVTILDNTADGQSRVFFSGNANTNGCLPGTITPPAGTECMVLQYPLLGGRGTAQTCFQVIGTLPPPTPGWRPIGPAPVDGNGNWNYDARLPIDPIPTAIRVTNAGCDADPASNLVWEGAVTRTPLNRVGMDVWQAELAPEGLAVSSGGSGHARLSRTVTLNAPVQVDVTLFGVGMQYAGTPLTVCFQP